MQGNVSDKNLKDMGKSDEYIEYDAYMRYLKKVTVEQADQQKMKGAVLFKTAERTELHMALVLLKRLSAAAAIVIICALGMAGFALASSSGTKGDEDNLWSRSRVEDGASKGGMKLYEAYEHSKHIREKFL